MRLRRELDSRPPSGSAGSAAVPPPAPQPQPPPPQLGMSNSTLFGNLVAAGSMAGAQNQLPAHGGMQNPSSQPHQHDYYQAANTKRFKTESENTTSMGFAPPPPHPAPAPTASIPQVAVQNPPPPPPPPPPTNTTSISNNPSSNFHSNNSNLFYIRFRSKISKQ